MTLEGSIALVTGAGRGIGKSIATTLARNGATVVLTARTVSDLEAVRKKIESSDGKALCIPVDLTNASQIEKLFDEVSSRFHRLGGDHAAGTCDGQ